MKNYRVTIVETLEKVIEITAHNPDEAKTITESRWKNGYYILTTDNSIGASFDVEEIEKEGE